MGGYLLGTSGTPDQDLEVSYGYDAQGRMQTVTSGAGVFAYGYVNDSDLLAGVEGPVVTAAHTYEPNRDLRTEVRNQVGETTISRYTYRYDAIGRRGDRVQAGDAFAQTTYDKFSYNDRNEVVETKNFEGNNPSATGDTEVTALC